jgi:hypothetical protein
MGDKKYFVFHVSNDLKEVYVCDSSTGYGNANAAINSCMNQYFEDRNFRKMKMRLDFAGVKNYESIVVVTQRDKEGFYVSLPEGAFLSESLFRDLLDKASDIY